MKYWCLLLFSFALCPKISLAAACCGASFASPSLITGDNAAQFAGTYTRSNIEVENVDSRGVWHKKKKDTFAHTYRIEGAHLLSDRWQTGLQIPFIHRNKSSDSFSNIGDLSLLVGYEYLSNWSYHPWRPKGIGFLQVIVPTGKSKLDSNIGGLDSTGIGRWSVGLGSLFSREFLPWDIMGTVEIHHNFPSVADIAQRSRDLTSSQGGSLQFGVGFNWNKVRFGSSLAWKYEGAILDRQSSQTLAKFERFATATVSLAYLFSSTWSGNLSYADQALFGSPINTSLSKSASVSLQRIWDR